MPGNNDVEFQPEIVAEFAHQRGLIELIAAGPRERSQSLGQASGRVEVCGYSLHPLSLGGRELTLLAGRPNSMGGGELAFVDHLSRNYGVATMAESTERIRKLVSEVPTEELLLFSHNGPAGLGEGPADIWGCDFRKGAGDWGDPDLSAALEHAREIGKRVVAVIGGHMHWKTRTGEMRTSQLERDGTLYINAARVPRIYGGRDGMNRAHLCIEIGDAELTATEVIVTSDA